MIRSMTGYGMAELERSGQRLAAEIRSVNHRYCEVSLRAPKLAQLFEDQIRQLIADRFSRGKFNLTITWAGVGEDGGVLRLNEGVADRYMAAMKQLKERYSIGGEIDLRTLAGLPDLFTWEHATFSDEEAWTLVKEVVEKSCESMNGMKAREGAALAADLSKRLAIVKAELIRVSARAPLRPQEAKDRMVGRIKALLDDVEMDPIRIAQEVAMLSDRLDCTEECVRLDAHLDQFQSLMDGAEMAGRKLNFLLQEMNREANTIGSKANDVEIAHAVVVMKEELERLREQVQNVE